MHLIQQIPELHPILDTADHYDIKTSEGTATIHEFVDAVRSYKPGWLKLLAITRAGLFRILGISEKKNKPEQIETYREFVEFSPGIPAGMTPVYNSIMNVTRPSIRARGKRAGAFRVPAPSRERGFPFLPELPRPLGPEPDRGVPTARLSGSPLPIMFRPR